MFKTKFLLILMLISPCLALEKGFSQALPTSPTPMGPSVQGGGGEKRFGSKAHEKPPFDEIKGFTANFGVKIGYGFSSAIIDNHTSSSSGFFQQGSLSGGIFTHFSHVHFVRLQLEALYIKRGFQRSNYQADLDCFNFPILVRIQPPLGFFINFGIGINYIIGGSVSDATNNLHYRWFRQ